MTLFKQILVIVVIVLTIANTAACGNTMIPADCNRSNTSYICNPDSIVSDNYCDEFDRFAIEIKSQSIKKQTICQETNYTSLYLVYGLAVDHTPYPNLDHKDALKQYARDIYKKWGLDHNCNDILILSAVKESGVYIDSGNQTHPLESTYVKLYLNSDYKEEIGKAMVILAEAIELVIGNDKTAISQIINNTIQKANATNTVNGSTHTEKKTTRGFKHSGVIILAAIAVVMFTITIVVTVVYLKKQKSNGYTAFQGVVIEGDPNMNYDPYYLPQQYQQQHPSDDYRDSYSDSSTYSDSSSRTDETPVVYLSPMPISTTVVYNHGTHEWDTVNLE